MSYCIYLRKSRADAEAEARGEGETLARHQTALLELAKRMQLNITQIHREIVSGETIAARPIMQLLLSEVEQGMWDGVLVMEVERLARGDTMDQGLVAQTFKYSGCKIITPIKTYDPSNEFDEEYFEFGLFMSRREYKTINRRLQRGREASVRQGKFISSTAPYGYMRAKIPGDKGYTLQIVPDEAEAVKLIYNLYVNGELQPDGTYKRLGSTLIARRLDDLCIKTRGERIWSPSSVRDILKNPVYAGYVKWRWRPAVKTMQGGAKKESRPRANEQNRMLEDGVHTPIIDRETYFRAQALFKSAPPSPVTSNATLQNPLAGIVYCGKCGRSLVRLYNKKKGSHPALICPSTKCSNASSLLSEVEISLLHALRDWAEEYKTKCQTPVSNSENQNIAVLSSALKRLQAEKETFQQQLTNIYDYFERGIYDESTFIARSQALSDKIKNNSEMISEAQGKLSAEELRQKNQSTIIPRIENLLRIYNTLPNAEAKNQMLKQILRRVEYTREEGGRWLPKDNFTLKIFPKLPDTL